MRKILLMAAMLFAFVAITTGQTRSVAGEVKDAQGNPIPFATVKVKGSKVAVAADQNGKFSINIPEDKECSHSTIRGTTWQAYVAYST